MLSYVDIAGTNLCSKPIRVVSGCNVDERRSDVHVGIVGPGVVFWDVLERTRSFVVDRNRDGGRS